MIVERVHTEHGSHIVPALSQSWSRLKKLEWQAAVAEVDSGVTLRVSPSDYRARVAGVWVRQFGYFDVSTPGAFQGPMSYDAAWSFINGVVAGAKAVSRA